METRPPGPDQSGPHQPGPHQPGQHQPGSADPSPPAGALAALPGSVAGTGTTAGVCEQVAVTRIGTQVVVRLAGSVAEPLRARLHQAVGEVECLVVTRVVVDLDEVTELGAAGLDFVLTLQQRWPVRLLNAPDGLRRGQLARPAV